MSPQTLVLVDADTGVLDNLYGLLNQEGRTIRSAVDGSEALQYARETPCDLVVAGQGRNGLGGIELLRRLRALRPETRVILTGEPGAERVLPAIRAHAYSYFHKPLSQGPLADMAQLALESEGWRGDLRVVSSVPEWISMEVRCKLEAAERATHYVRELAADLPRAVCEDVSAAFRELLLNAVEHGGGSDPRKRVRVSLVRTGRAWMACIRDPGKGFSIQRLPHAAISNPEDAPTRHTEFRAGHGQRPGGFGILMARKMVDELVYNERGNEVVLVKYAA